jgi:hypothetical protein
LENSKKWLLAGFSEAEIAVLRQLAGEIGFPDPILISPNQMDLTIGEILAGKSGHGQAEPLSQRLILFSDFQRSEISGFIVVYKFLSLPRPFFAAVTPYSSLWSLRKLLHELAEERAEIAAQKTQNLSKKQGVCPCVTPLLPFLIARAMEA